MSDKDLKMSSDSLKEGHRNGNCNRLDERETPIAPMTARAICSSL